MRYRPEIDGLRAVAVLPVIFFHAGFTTFGGGYVGVDVFFVISGYLITQLILKDLDAGTFSFRDFYERRARRIMPALLFVIICCIPFAWMWMLPQQMNDFAIGARAVALFVSNFWFWSKSGYFDQAAEAKPLLHTWSLAVEEQFYIVFPIIILLLHRFGRRTLVPAITAIALASLALSEYSSYNHPSFNFYLLPTRAWELAAGSLCAFVALEPGKTRDNLVSLLGLAAIFAAIICFGDATRFPSLYALLPVSGACAVIIFTRQGTLAYSLLSSPPLMGIGLISYSAYLWHQPLFAFARIRLLNEPSDWVMALLAAVSFLLAYLTWRFIELPVRRRGVSERFSRKTVFASSALLAALLVGYGTIAQATQGFPGRFPREVSEIADYAKDKNPRKACTTRVEQDLAPEDGCVYGNNSAVAFALLGDSHAHAIASQLGTALGKEGFGLLEMTHAGCPPIPQYTRTGDDGISDCHTYYQSAQTYLHSQKNIGTVILFARWPLYAAFDRFDNGEGGVEWGTRVVPAASSAFGNDDAGNRKKIGALYIESINEFLAAGKRVVIIYPQPEIGWDVPTYVAKLVMFGKSGMRPVSVSMERFKNRSAFAYAQLDSIKAENVLRVLPEKIFCDTIVKNRCAAEDGRTLYYNDDDHLSSVGAAMLSREVIRTLKENNWIAQ